MQVYNYLLESYPIKREVMYPAHKRSELRKIYNSIVKLSKHSPLYRINLSKENQEFTIGIKETALYLRDKLEEMSAPGNPVFQSKAAAVSDEGVLSARLLSDDTEGIPEKIIFNVEALASVQVNRGKELLQTSRGLKPGTYEFSVKVMDNIYPLTYIQEERTENQEAVKKMADFLNKSVPGINAMVERDSSPDYSRLVIMSDQAAKHGEQAVSFSESNYFGIVDYFGMNRIEKASSPARFTLNGVDKQTSTNTFHLDNKLRVTLNSTSEQPVTIRIVPNSKKILSAVGTVLDTYNNLIRLARNRILNNRDHYRASRLLNEMKNLEKAYEEELNSSGLEADENGFLLAGGPLAVKAAEDGSMKRMFTREKGFAARLAEKAETIAINPMEYLEKTIVTYPDNDANSFRNPYITSMYSGLFFSSYC